MKMMFLVQIQEAVGMAEDGSEGCGYLEGDEEKGEASDKQVAGP